MSANTSKPASSGDEAVGLRSGGRRHIVFGAWTTPEWSRGAWVRAVLPGVTSADGGGQRIIMDRVPGVTEVVATDKALCGDRSGPARKRADGRQAAVAKLISLVEAVGRRPSPLPRCSIRTGWGVHRQADRRPAREVELPGYTDRGRAKEDTESVSSPSSDESVQRTILGDRVRMQDVGGVYIARWRPRAPRRPGAGDSAGADLDASGKPWVVIETVGVGPSKSRSQSGRHHGRRGESGWATACRRTKPGCSRSPISSW
jgi:hypothetical protein